ncbi:MAG: Fe-S cluster assembly protein SufD [Verrucomicrobiales bacterium]
MPNSPETKESAAEATSILSAGPVAAEPGMPQWFRDGQAAAWGEFAAAPMPVRKDEAWRFANLKRVAALDSFAPADPVSGEAAAQLVKESKGLAEPCARLVFANDHLIHESDGVRELREQGVLCLPLAYALMEYGDLVEKHFMVAEVELGSAKFAALHRARVRSGTFLFVPKGVVVDRPIEVFHWASGDGAAIFPHTLIIAEENAQVAVFDHFCSAAEGEAHFACGVNDLSAETGARVTYAAAQQLSAKSSAIQINSTTVGRDAEIRQLQAQLGAGWSRTESVSHLTGPGANSLMLSAAVATAGQEIDQRTLQHHESERATSDLLYKNVLFGDARTIFAGLIQVDERAHYTDAYQKCRNLLMSDEAEANSMPGLEINADQVKCSHGATTGQISEEELFYLEARGIPPESAKRLIATGFAFEAIDRLGNPAIQDLIEALVEQRFANLAE